MRYDVWTHDLKLRSSEYGTCGLGEGWGGDIGYCVELAGVECR